jgi:hypothetical protein
VYRHSYYQKVTRGCINVKERKVIHTCGVQKTFLKEMQCGKVLKNESDDHRDGERTDCSTSGQVYL